jgi:hypothetical protein
MRNLLVSFPKPKTAHKAALLRYSEGGKGCEILGNSIEVMAIYRKIIGASASEKWAQ